MTGNNKKTFEGRKFRTVLAFLFGIGGGSDNQDMPQDDFGVALDMLMPH
jgi:hypothetical protein